MRKKQFKAESKKLMDMMINSIYTHKEVFIREIISNASDALDKLYFKSLTDSTVGLNKDDFCIRLSVNKNDRTLTISDNGCGMTEDELENNLGTIAKSGSLAFKTENEQSEDVENNGVFSLSFSFFFFQTKKKDIASPLYVRERGLSRPQTGERSRILLSPLVKFIRASFTSSNWKYCTPAGKSLTNLG